jgi:D-alanyl-D-alanine carboxypeptidase/D-alanyl-D-alanine-endopeptidase (penicillin-binding protein 4)
MRLLVLLAALLTQARAEDRPDRHPSDPTLPSQSLSVPAPPSPVAAALADVTKSWVFRKAHVGLHVVDLETGEEVFASGAETLLNPASTMKIVTSAAALRTLGPAYRFTTEVSYDGELTTAGVLKGDLYVKGRGDPTFVAEKLWRLVRDLKLAGIERIDGSVLLDDSFHSGGSTLPGWSKPEDVERGTPYFATLSALSLDANTVTLVVGPAAESGSPARVELEVPVKGYVEIDSKVSTGPPGSRRWIEVERVPGPDTVKFTLTGSVPAGDPERLHITRTVPDPTTFFTAALRAQMETQGIAVTGRFKKGTVPPEAEMVDVVESPPLSVVLADMNKLSINFIAEQVVRTLGAEVSGTGTTEAGLAVVRSYLDGLGVRPEEAVLVNGSGLSRSSVVAPVVLTAVLTDMARDEQVSAEFTASLSIGGTDGTLWSRLRDEPGRLRGKTGTIENVHCLAGYLDADDGRRYAFAFLVNDHGGRAQAVRDTHDSFARSMFGVHAPDRAPSP